ncbi:hypothetical protein SUGI_1093050 [Cryptomeria japonica]|nr:hypothetical protein SUGI_1093050 [Cryptomeria japonica]
MMWQAVGQVTGWYKGGEEVIAKEGGKRRGERKVKASRRGGGTMMNKEERGLIPDSRKSVMEKQGDCWMQL